MVGILLSYWEGLFSGAMLVSGRVMFLPFSSRFAHRKFLKVRGATEGNKNLTIVVFDAELAPSSRIGGLNGKPTCERFCGRNEFLENWSVIQSHRIHGTGIFTYIW